jgi:cell shape-determining protein MreD
MAFVFGLIGLLIGLFLYFTRVRAWEWWQAALLDVVLVLIIGVVVALADTRSSAETHTARDGS